MPDPVEVRRGVVDTPSGPMLSMLFAEQSFHSGKDKVPGELALCKQIAETLTYHYPGHAWGVEVMADQGIARIMLPPLLGDWSYNMHLDGDMSTAAIVRAGGEILERFKIPRSNVNLAAYADAKDRIPLIGRFRGSNRSIIPA